MTVEIRDNVIALSGALRQNDWPALQPLIQNQLRRGGAFARGIVVDASGVESITDEGAQTLRDAARHVSGSRSHLTVIGLHKPIADVLQKIADADWSLRLADDTGKNGSATKKVDPNRIVVAVLGTAADTRAVSLASNLCPPAARGGELILLRPLLLSRERAMCDGDGCPEYADATGVLETLKMKLKESGRESHGSVELTRNRARLLLQRATEMGAGRIVAGIGADADDETREVAAALLRDSSVPVTLVRLPESTTSAKVRG